MKIMENYRKKSSEKKAREHIEHICEPRKLVPMLTRLWSQTFKKLLSADSREK